MRRIRSAVLLALALTASTLSFTASPAQAAGESFEMVSVNTTGCASGNFGMTVLRSNLDGSPYTVRTVVRVDRKVYMNEAATISVTGESGWNLFNNFTYGTVPNPGTWPIPEDTLMRIDFTLERPVGTVLYSWRTVVNSCNEGSVIYNGVPADDEDGNYVPIVRDECPGLPATTLDGCPQRSLTLAYEAPRKRLVGWLVADGFPVLFSGKKVTLWKVKAGPDQKIVTLRTSKAGNFSLPKPSKGTYYVTSPRLAKPGVYEIPKITSATVKVRR